MFQDKGQARMVSAFLDAIHSGERAPIPFRETASVMRATFRAVDSLLHGSALMVPKQA